MLRRLQSVPALAVALALAACTSTVAGTATPVGGALARLTHDVDLHLTEGAEGQLLAAFADSTGSPVVVYRSAAAGYPQVLRGTGPAEPVTLEEFGENGYAHAAALAPDDTLVIVGYAGEDSEPSVVRVAPDDSVQVLPLTGPGTADTQFYSAMDAVGFTPDGRTAVLAWAVDDYSQGYPLMTGELQVWRLDTTTGELSAGVRVPVAQAGARVPGEASPLSVRDVIGTTDGGATVAVDAVTGTGSAAQLVRFDAQLTAAPPVTVAADAPVDDRRFLAADAAGTVYVTLTTGDGTSSSGTVTQQVVSLPAGATEPSVLVTLPDQALNSGLAVDAAGEWAYLTGLLSADYTERVSALDLRTGRLGPEVTVCEQGYAGEPVLNATGTTLAVSAQCGGTAADQLHVYLLGS